MSTESDATEIELEIKNVGGIEYQEISIDPGLTVLSGVNATNRTSLLKAIMALAGSDEPPIRSGTERGYVKGEINNEVYEREVTAAGNGYSWSGEGYCDDPTLAELYSFLWEQNEVRQTVANGGDLRELIMRPVDTDEIEAREQELIERKSDLKHAKGEIDEKKARIERFKQTISSKIEQKEELLENKSDLEEQIENFEGDISKQQSKFDKSTEIQDQIGRVSRKINDVKSKIDTLESNLENQQEELSKIDTDSDDEIADINAKIHEIEQKKDRLENKQDQIQKKQDAITPLRTFISHFDGNVDIAEINQIISEHTSLTRTSGSSDDESVTDELISGSGEDEVCIFCGADVEPGHYEELDSKVSEAHKSLSSKKSEIGDEVSDLVSSKSTLKTELAEIRNKKDQKENVAKEIENLEGKIQSKQQQLEDLQDEKADLEEEHKEVQQGLEDDVQRLISLNSKLVEAETDIEDVESTIESRKEDLSKAEDELEDLKDDVKELDQVRNELKEVRNKVEEIESSVVGQFNERMDDVLNRLEYTGIERIWIQAREVRKRKGRRNVMETVFDLNIVREIDGTTTEDTIDNLSESEREVTGLIFALTGFLVHDVGDVFPVTLMDSIEMVDSNRIEELLRYFGQYTEYLVVAALPADADQIDVGEGAIVEMAN